MRRHHARLARKAAHLVQQFLGRAAVVVAAGVVFVRRDLLAHEAFDLVADFAGAVGDAEEFVLRRACHAHDPL